MSWALLVIYTAVFLYLIHRVKFFRLEGLKPWMPPVFFLAKIVAAFALWWVYTFYYTDKQNSDIWKYFDDSKVMYAALETHPSDYFRMVTGFGDEDPRIDQTYYHTMTHWYQQFDNNLLNDAHIIIRFNAVVRLISMGNYHIHALLMCFLAFIGLCGMYRAIYPAVKQWPKLAACCIFLLPSLLFWGSGVMKEGLMLLGLGGVVYQAFAFFNDRRWYRLLLLIGFAWLVFLTKFYVLAALLPALAGAGWVMKKPNGAIVKFGVVLLVFLAAGLSIKFVHKAYDPLRVLAWKQNDFLKLSRGGTYLLSDSVVAFIAADHHDDLVKETDSIYHIKPGADYIYWYFEPDFSDTLYATNSRDAANYTILTDFPRAGSLMETDLLQPELLSFLEHTPQALYRSLFRPFVWEGKNPLLLFPALENLLFMLLLLLAIVYYKKPSSPALAGFCFTFALLLLIVMGITTPVLGALVRYRIAAQPFLLVGLLMCIDKEKLLRKIKNSKIQNIGVVLLLVWFNSCSPVEENRPVDKYSLDSLEVITPKPCEKIEAAIFPDQMLDYDWRIKNGRDNRHFLLGYNYYYHCEDAADDLRRMEVYIFAPDHNVIKPGKIYLIPNDALVIRSNMGGSGNLPEEAANIEGKILFENFPGDSIVARINLSGLMVRSNLRIPLLKGKVTFQHSNPEDWNGLGEIMEKKDSALAAFHSGNLQSDIGNR